MLVLLLAGAFLFVGWYLSVHAREYLYTNRGQWHQILFGSPKETRSSNRSSNLKCFCKQPNCQRYLSRDVKFHEKQVVTQRINESLESLFDCVIERFVTQWYRDISSNDDFVDDIRVNLHFVCANALHRLKQVNLPNLICQKVVPTAARHLHMCLASAELHRPSSSHQSQDDRLLEKLSGHLHVAMKSRSTEQLYIRSLVTSIMPHLLHNTIHLHSRSTVLLLEEILSVAVLLPALDVLATPDILNKLILIGLNNSSPPQPTLPVSENVEILQNYRDAFRSRLPSTIPITNIHALYGNTVLFHQFMQYLKSLHLVDLLNIFGQLDEINSKVLQPEIPEAMKSAIHRDLSLLHESLAHEPALPLLELPDSFLSDILSLIQGSSSNVDRLQTCDSWFKAYDNVCTLLESVLLPQFFQSDCYFDAQYSSAPGQSTQKSSSSLKRRDFSFTKITGKVKDILKFQSVVEGEFPPGPPTAYQAEDAAVILLPQNDFTPDESPRSECPDDGEESEADMEVHDLSGWEVSMPTISQGYRQSLVKSETVIDDAIRRGAGLGPNSSPNQLTFVIEVREKGVSQSVWRIHRRYQEFYVLHEKLCEFHGSNLHDVVLPTKKSFGIKNVDFLERMKPEFEQYLMKLLCKPFLHNSELLYRFLSQSDLEFNNSINLGKFMKSVNIKLIKTRGQYLANFMQTLHSSTEGRKPVPSVTEPSAGKSLRDTCLHNHLFWNNAAGAVRLRQTAIQRGLVSPGCDQRMPYFRTITDVVDWIIQWASSTLTGVKTAPSTPVVRSTLVTSWIRGFIFAVRPFFEPLVEELVKRAIAKGLHAVLQEHRISPVIEALRDILFFDDGNQRSLTEKQERRESANQAVLNILMHPPLDFLFDDEQLKTQLHEVFGLLQLPKVNKQLSYVLLDDLVQELFPEVSTDAIKQSVIASSSESSCLNESRSGLNNDTLT